MPRPWWVTSPCLFPSSQPALADNHMGSESRKQNRFICDVETHTRLWLLLFCFTGDELVLFAQSTGLPPRVLASHATDRDQTWRLYAPPSVGTSLPSLRGVGGLCLEVSLGTWKPDPVLYQLFAIQNRSFPTRQKNDPEMGQAPTSQARTRDTAHLRNLAARTLTLVEHTLQVLS